MASVNVTFEGPFFDDPDLGGKITRRFMDYMAQALSHSIPRMRRGLPYRTGNLRRSLRIAYDRNKRIVRIGFVPKGYYWRFQPKVRRDMERVFEATIQLNTQSSFNKAIQDVLA